MQLAPYVHALQEDLAKAAELAGGEAAQEAAERLAQALGPALQLRLLDLLSEIALSLTTQVPGRIEVRLAGREPELVYVEDEEAEPAAPAGGDDAFTARITLRLAETLKAQVEVAAARESLSVNAWIVRALARGLETRSVRAGRRLTGYAES
jgi:HicB family